MQCLFGRTKAVCILFLLALTLLAASCGGSDSAAPELGKTQVETAAPVVESSTQAGMPELPSPSEISRDASLVETGLSVQGSSFRKDLTHQNITTEGTNALYDPVFTTGPDAQYSSVALAIYSFDVSSSSPDELSTLDFELDGMPDLVIGTANVFAGFPAVSLEKWDWTEMSKSATSPSSGVSTWSMACPNEMPVRAPNGILNVCVVLFGDTAVDVSRVALVRSSTGGEGGASMDRLFSRGFGYIDKSSPLLFDSLSMTCDEEGRLHATCFDPSSRQLYYYQYNNRVLSSVCVECSSSSGTSSSLCPTPDGGYFLSYTVDDGSSGACRWMAPESISSRTWSSSSTFEASTGREGSFRSCRCVFDDDGTAHIFYVDTSSSRVKHAWQSRGNSSWNSEFVSPEGESASCPSPMRCADGVCVAYISSSSDDGGALYLSLAQQSPTGWSSDVLAEDVRDPFGEGGSGFCAGANVPGTDRCVVAYSSSSGLRVVHRDVAARNTLSSSQLSSSSSSGAFVCVRSCGDGSVRVLHYDTSSKTVFYEDGDMPDGSSFSSVPLMAYDGKDNDCNGLAFYLDDDSDGDGLREVCVADLSSSLSELTGEKRYEFRGHVTVLK